MNAYYQEGYDAFKGTLASASACPYRKGTFAFTEWVHGFCDAWELYWGL